MTPSNPAFEERVAALLPLWRNWLRVKHRDLEAQHSDIVQDAATDLLSWVRARSSALDDDDLRRVGFRVLQRRVSDAYRHLVKHWADEELPTDYADPVSGSDPSALLAHKQQLRALIAVLATLAPGDRALLVGDEIGQDGDEGAVRSPAQRQRLVRLRRKVRATLGMPVPGAGKDEPNGEEL